MPHSAGIETMRKSWLDRGFSLFTDVHAGEGFNALLLAVNVFFLLAFYSVLKVIRDALILSEAGAVVASYAAAGQALLLLGFVPAYGAFASRVNRLRLVCGVTLFFASHLIIFYLLGAAGMRIGVAFYLWIGVFNMVAIAQFWAFANDLYTTERGKRLFPILGVGANLGAVVGAGATAAIFGGIGPYPLMLLSSIGLLVPIALTIWVNGRERRVNREAAAAAEAEKPLGKEGGFQLVLRQRYLLLIALLIVALNLVNTLGGFVLNQMMEQEAVRVVAPDVAAAPGSRPLSGEETQAVRAAIGTLSGTNQTWWNLLAFVFQLFLISRIFKYIGVRGALFIMPLIALGGYMMIALLPLFGIVRVVKILENGTDYSIQNTTKHALFLPTSREAKYKAKQAIDAFFVRAGDFLQAVVVFIGSWLALNVRQFAIVNVVFVALALVLVVAIRREHKKLVPVDVARKAA
jgi:AAA family ATP:ADP antiporter